MLRLQAFGELLRRYGAVFAASWGMRHQLAAPHRLDHELAFLPASLELVETPVHPVPRWTMVITSLLVVIGLGIAFLGKLEIVATAKGKLLPNARVKMIQPALTGVVRRILVQDGQRVAAGDLLVELDPSQAAADSTKAHSARIANAIAAARSSALLDAQAHGHLGTVATAAGADAQDQQEAQRYAEGVFHEYQDKAASAQADLVRREAELEGTRHQIEKLRDTAPLARQQANDYKALIDRKYVTHTEYLDKEQNALQQEHELAVQLSHSQELAAAIVAQRATVAGIASQFRREQLDALDKASQQLTQGREDETKAQVRQELMTLKAPVSGTVQQLTVHTVGGVVTTAQSLMEIVPDDVMEVEATLENKDVGFVQAGQAAVVKVEAFPYTRYGYLHGTVKSVSNDATQDKRQGLVFVTHIQIPTNRMQINGQWVNLTPGMAVTAEITTGKRSAASYFLDPFMQTTQESLRER